MQYDITSPVALFSMTMLAAATVWSSLHACSWTWIIQLNMTIPSCTPGPASSFGSDKASHYHAYAVQTAAGKHHAWAVGSRCSMADKVTPVAALRTHSTWHCCCVVTVPMDLHCLTWVIPQAEWTQVSSWTYKPQPFVPSWSGHQHHQNQLLSTCFVMVQLPRDVQWLAAAVLSLIITFWLDGDHHQMMTCTTCQCASMALLQVLTWSLKTSHILASLRLDIATSRTSLKLLFHLMSHHTSWKYLSRCSCVTVITVSAWSLATSTHSSGVDVNDTRGTTCGTLPSRDHVWNIYIPLSTHCSRYVS